jgi:hypothetical protein
VNIVQRLVRPLKVGHFSMKTKGWLPAVLLCLLSPCTARAAEGHALGTHVINPPAANLRLFTDKVPSGKIERAVLQSGNDQFSFVMPEGFRSTFDPATRNVRLVSPDLQATMIIAVLAAPQKSDSEVSAPSLYARALADYPGAHVVDQFEVSVGNWRGPAIELECPNGSAKKTSVRLAHVPFPGGVLAFTVHAPANLMRACDHHFNQLLLSIRAGLDGHAAALQQFLPDQ